MGANNCKSAADMQPLFDDVFDYTYWMLGLSIVMTFVWWMPGPLPFGYIANFVL